MTQPSVAPEALAFGDRATEYERGRPSYAPAAIDAPHRTSDQRDRTGACKPALRDFGVTVGEPRRFANPQTMTRQAVVDRGLSTSFITALAATLPERLQFPYLTDVYVVTLAAG